jgi:hypothetical protein
MTTGEMLYLLMTIGAVTVLALVLAYYSRQQTLADRAKAGQVAEAPGAAPVGARHA